MRTYSLISRMLHGGLRQKIRTIILFILMFFVQHYITLELFGMYTNYYDSIGRYIHPGYDTVLFETNETDFALQFTQSNVEDVVYFTIPPTLSGVKYKNGTHECFDPENADYTNTNGYFGGTLEDVVRIVLGKNMLSMDRTLLRQPGTILLSEDIAAKVRVRVGDTVWIQCPTWKYTFLENGDIDTVQASFDGRTEYPFRVAGIYRISVVGIARAVIATSDAEPIIEENYPQQGEQEWVLKRAALAFVKFKDTDLAETELAQYIQTPFSQFYKYHDAWRDHMSDSSFSSYEEYRDLCLQGRLGTRYQSRLPRLKRAEFENVVNTKTVILYTALTVVLMSLLFWVQNYRTVQMQSRNFGILAACGMSRRKIFVFGAVSSAWRQLLMMLLSFTLLYGYHCITAFPEYTFNFSIGVLSGVYIPLGIGVLACAILNGIIACAIVSRRKMMQALTAETTEE